MSDNNSVNTAFVTANPLVLQAHMDEAEFLFSQRDLAVSDPSFTLNDLADLDWQLALHLRGILAAGNTAVREHLNAMVTPDPGTVFASCAVALQTGDGALLSETIDAAVTREHLRAIVSATGWVPVEHFQGFANALVCASSIAYQYIGLAGFAIRRRDLGERLHAYLHSPVRGIRIRACRAVGELGRKDLVPELRAHFDSENEQERYWAIWSACVLGNPAALSLLREFVTHPAYSERAIQVYFRFCGITEAHTLLRDLAGNPKLERYALIGSGILGDPVFVPGLLSRMTSPALARVAGEAFCLITGMDSEHMGSTNTSPEIEANAQPEWDLELPWPCQHIVENWWNNKHSGFENGQRYLCGQLIDAENCNRVLRFGFQRQRIAAAFELTRLMDNRPLFSWKAPGFNQKETVNEF
jgi:uncharacterized protein (TIGR02270 family)